MSEEHDDCHECDGGNTKEFSIVPDCGDVEYRYSFGWEWMPFDRQQFTSVFVAGPVDAFVNDIPVRAVADDRGGINITITAADREAMRGLQDLRDSLSEFPPAEQAGEAGTV